LTGRIDFAIRAAVELAARDGYIPLDALAQAQALPTDYVRTAMRDLRRSGIVTSRRGHDGGYRLNRAADAITLADIIRAVDGPLTEVRGERPEEIQYLGAAQPLQEVWVALRAQERAILEGVTLADIVAADLPAVVRQHA
jgi:Rrf2 family protein